MAESTLSVIKRTYSEWSSHNAMRLAAAMSFYTMMSLAPMLVVALTITSLIYKGGASDKIHHGAASLVGEDGAKAVDQMLAATASHSNGGIWAAVLSFSIAIISASGLFISLQDAINTIWDVKPRPDAGWKAMVRSRLISVALLIAAGALLLTSIYISSTIAKGLDHMPAGKAWLSIIGDLIISFFVLTGIFALVFKYLPDVIIDWKDVLLGAAITAALFMIGKYGISFYFRFASTTAFGAAGSLAALLIFVYYAATLVFFGAEFTRVYAESKGKPVQPDHYAMKLTTEDRGKRGEPHPEELEDAKEKADGKTPQRPAPKRAGATTYGTVSSGATNPKTAGQYLTAGAGLAVAAVIGGVTTLLLTGEERKIRARAEQLRLRDRLDEAERHMYRAGKIHDLLERMSVSKRMDNVTERINETLRRSAAAAAKKQN